MELDQTVYPLSRYWYSGDFEFYYAYGNTPARDFLQNCVGEKEPDVLVLGCGDIRSCFYSLWKNFNIKDPNRFNGVHFVLNDISAAVLARDILFLYLCFQMPKEEEAIKKWLSAMWAIWYCHELYPEHHQLLNDTLRILSKYSDSWSSSDNPLYPMVKFSSPSTVNEVRNVWKMWLEQDIDVASVKDMHSARQAYLIKSGWMHKFDSDASDFVKGSTAIPFENCNDSTKSHVQKSEALAYLKCGSVYAENVLELDVPSTKTFVNFTLYERKDGKYNLHYQSLPFRCYYHTVDFSNKQLESLHATNSIELLVKDEHFTSKPLLANSVQQFCLWLMFSHKVLNSKHVNNISFMFDCSHALTFCYELEHHKKTYELFDLIYSSNLMDHLGPPNLILSAIPLLKDNGLLFTATLFGHAFSSLEECLECSFGFDCKLFPVLLGIRCINYEGVSYASPVSVQPCPLIISTGFMYEKMLIWEKSKSDTVPLVFPSDQPITDIPAKALLNTILVSVYPLIQTSRVAQMMNHLCVETAIKVLQVFISRVNANFDPQFWKPLSDEIQKSIKPYLSSIQTHLYLHGIHMHLTVGKRNCPFCFKKSISDSICLFSARLFLQEEFAIAKPKFMAIVHKEKPDNAEYLCNIARSGGNVHIFDCISPSAGSKDRFLQLYFYAPLNFVQEEYKVTMVVVYIFGPITNFVSNVRNLPTQPLSHWQISFTRFKFFQATTCDNKFDLGSFGTITSHVGDGDSSDVEIVLFQPVMHASTSKKLQTQRVSSNALQLSYGQYTCRLNYPYPIAYDNIKIKRKDSKICIHCPRTSQRFTEEKPLFIVTPEKEMSLLYFTLTDKAMTSLSGQQFTRWDRYTMESSAELPPLIRVKKSLLHFFQMNDHFYHFILPKNAIHGLVVINNRLFDYEHRIPVVDLAFCFLEESFVDSVVPAWINISPEQVYSVAVDNQEYEVLKEVFYYFAARTNGTLSTMSNLGSRLKLLIHVGIQQYFTRAVISLLLCNPDHFIQMIMDKINSPVSQGEVTNNLDAKSSENCDNCGIFFEGTRMCSKCKKAKYCSKKCQREHWKFHKAACKKETDIVENKAAKKADSDFGVVSTDEAVIFQPFPLARFCHDGDFRFYYAYGNTPAEDFLQNCVGVKKPLLLLLGCGDIRSCFYTLWRNLDSSISKVPKRFDGVHYILNDNSSSVQARNIIFLYLCFQLPKGIMERKKWLCAMWAIWYCHELHPQHQRILEDSLKMLLIYSESQSHWACKDNPLRSFVNFTSSTCLAEISLVWKTWLEKKYAVKQMHFSRLQLLKQNLNVSDFLFSYTARTTYVHCDTVDSVMKKIHVRKPEVTAYIESGNCYAEHVLNVELLNSPTTVNPTLYERFDGRYTLHYESMPFIGYYHTVEFSPDALVSAGVDKSDDTMLVQSKSFSSLPFLANSVQQFSIWVQSTSKVFNVEDNLVSFTFNNQHAVSFCQDLLFNDFSKLNVCGNQFDVIHSSNLIDHLGPPNLILPAISLLKPDGLLYTCSLIYQRYVTSINEYLNLCFGFDCKLLPVILGICCIDHEGEEYSSPVKIKPFPFNIMRQFRNLIWKKVSAQPFEISRLPQLVPGNITDALFNSIEVSTSSFLTTSSEDGKAILNNLSIETGIHVLQKFRSLVSTELSNNDFQFWKPLSSALHRKLKPFIYCLQTQSFLHNLHLHLTVTEDNCPMCKHSAINEHIGLFCAEAPLPIEDCEKPHFLVLIHQSSSSNAQHLCNEAMRGNNVHIFDCMDGIVQDKTLKLKFFAPLNFMVQDYKLTLALFGVRPNITTVLPAKYMKDLQIDFAQYSFSQVTNLHNHPKNDFGELTLHVGDGDKMKSEISLFDSALEALTVKKLSTKKMSSNEIQLSCGMCQLNLTFVYPIDYNKICVQLSKARKNITIVSPRQTSQLLFKRNEPVFITIPDHQLSIPPQDVTDQILISHSGMQMNQVERQISNSCNRSPEFMTPLMKVKECFMTLFQLKNEFYFCVSSSNGTNVGLILVNQLLFDYEHGAPALDLAFCFPDPINNSGNVGLAWSSIRKDQSTRIIIVDNDEHELLKTALFYFAKQTNGDCQSAGIKSKYQVLCQNNIDQYFTRAVIYLLYCDPQGINDINMGPDIPMSCKVSDPALDEKCGYCGKHCAETKKCTGCKRIQYCSKDCQTNDWPTHRSDCKTTISNKVSKPGSVARPSTGKQCVSSVACKQLETVCNYCYSVSKALKKCIKCGEAQYCGKECQAKHWPIHKTICKKQSDYVGPHSTSMLSQLKSEDTVIAESTFCAYCGSSSGKLMTCGRCKLIKYCSKDCQEKHWKKHKITCK